MAKFPLQFCEKEKIIYIGGTKVTVEQLAFIL